MPSAAQYREFAEQCRRFAKEARTDEQRQMLREIEAIWLELASEDERKAASRWRTPPDLAERRQGNSH
jgi:hypothetical protein